MFNTLFRKASTLDKAIVLSVAAMLSFNIVVLANQLQAPSLVAHAASADAAQA